MHFAFLHFIHTLLSTVHISHDTTFSSTDMSPRIILCQKKHFSFASAFYSFHFVQIKFQCIYHFSSASTQLGDAKEKVVPRFQCGAPVFASANFAPVSHQLIEHLSKFTHRYFSSSQTRYKNIIKVTFFSNQVITYERLFLFFAPSISFSGGQHVPKYEDKQDQILYTEISVSSQKLRRYHIKGHPGLKILLPRFNMCSIGRVLATTDGIKLSTAFQFGPMGHGLIPAKGDSIT